MATAPLRSPLSGTVAAALAATILSACSASAGTALGPGVAQAARCCAARAHGAHATSGYLYVARFNYTEPKFNDIFAYAPGKATPALAIKIGANAVPIGLAFDKIGDLYALFLGPNSGGSVVEYAPGKTTPMRTIANGISSPQAFTVTGSGVVYVANCPVCQQNHPGTGSVTVYVPGRSSPVSTIQTGVNTPVSVTTDGKGMLYVANCPAPFSTGPCGKQIAPVALPGSVSVYAPGRTKPAYVVTNGIDGPSFVATDAENRLYVASAGSNEVAVYATGATLPSYMIWLAFGGGEYITGMAFDGSGTLFVATGNLWIYPKGSATSSAMLLPPEGTGYWSVAVGGDGTAYALGRGPENDCRSKLLARRRHAIDHRAAEC